MAADFSEGVSSSVKHSSSVPYYIVIALLYTVFFLLGTKI